MGELERLEKQKREIEAKIEQTKNDTTKLHVRRSPDDYRGNLDCIEILDNYEVGGRVNNYGRGDEETIYKNGVPVAVLVNYYGNNGESCKMANQEIYPLGKTEIIFEDD